MNQYRVSWYMWTPPWDRACITDQIHDNEGEAREQIKYLMTMLAPHPPRNCTEHVWDIKLQVRKVGEWELLS